ncbi:MAG: phosphoribosylamine--glycine ligase, partial [Clostridiales bacterium]
MNVLVIGNGAREHAIIYMLKKSPKIDKIYSIKPNAAIKKMTTALQIDLNDGAKLRTAIVENAIELVVVGPEKPLVDGIADRIADICSVFGPTKAAAQLEGSKVFAKDFMNRYDIPTAACIVVNSAAAARQKAVDFDFPHVWKVDGLAGGKGVFISNSASQDEAIIEKLFVDRIFGDSANEVILEEFLAGEELSVFALFDNHTYKYFSNAKDFKRAYDNNLGPNTGGMGALSPIAVSEEESDQIDSIINKTFQGIKKEGLDYRGV